MVDYVVDVQGFRDAQNGFAVKEVSVLALNRDHIGHWVATPPCAFTDLPANICAQNNYLSRRHHGIEWFDGDIQEKQIYRKLRAVARSARMIYTRGEEKAKLLRRVMSRQVTNLEFEECPAFGKLPPSDTYCMHHALRNPGEFVCSLNRAAVLKSWLLGRKTVDEVDCNGFSTAESEECNEQSGTEESFGVDTDGYVWSLPG